MERPGVSCFSRRNIVLTILIATSYFLGGRFGLLLPYADAHVTLLWPPIGIAFAAFFLTGRRAIFGTFLGAFAANFAVSPDWDLAAAIAAGNTLAPWIGARRLRAHAPDQGVFCSPVWFAKFVFWGVLVTSVVSATLGTFSLAVFGHAPGSNSVEVAVAWFLGDGAGVLSWAPILLLFDRRVILARLKQVSLAESGSILIVAIGSISLLFNWGGDSPGGYMLLALPTFAFAWATIRIHPWIGQSLVLLTVHWALILTAQGIGPFSKLPFPDASAICWAYLSVCAFVTLIIGTQTIQLVAKSSHLEVANKDLHSALQRARAADQAKDIFLGVLSHELRTPLNGLLMTAELLRRSDSVEETRDLGEYIATCGNVLLERINELIDLSKIRSGHMTLEPAPCDLAKILQDCVIIHRAAAVQKNLVLTLEIAAEDPLGIVADASRIRQVVGNLVSNAIKFTDNGSVTLSLTSTILANGSRSCRIQVIDTGRGIPRSRRHEIFQPFSQIRELGQASVGGTGLGLHICKTISDMMNGDLVVSDSPSGGSIFTFDFSAPTVEVKPSQPDPSPDPATLQSSLTVLLVEDNPVNSVLTKRLLEKYGCSVTLCSDGEQACDTAAQGNFDVILMDIQLPHMDGFEATQVIRRTCAPSIRIVGLSAQQSHDDRIEALKAGMDDFIPKPFTAKELRRVLALAPIDRHPLHT